MRVEPGQVLDDRDARREQPAVRGALARARVVDVERVDADERGSCGDEQVDRVVREVRVPAGAVGVRAPVPAPSRCARAPPGRRGRCRRSPLRRSPVPSRRRSRPARRATRASGSPARSHPSRKRCAGVSRYVPVLATMSMRPIWNSVPGAYVACESSKDRWSAMAGAGRPGYVTVPSSNGWLRSRSMRTY